MDVHIGEMNSTLQVTDSQALLNPQVLDQIVRIVMERMQEEQARERRLEEERRLRPAVSAEETFVWD